MLPELFEHFPKTRTELPSAYRAIYEAHYRKNRQGETAATSLSMRLERWLHLKVAEDARKNPGAGNETLEIGAGMLNQLAYEPGVRNYDIVEPFADLYRGSEQLSRVRSIYDSMEQVPAGQRYDRITSVAAFEHILNLPGVAARAALLLRDGGSLRVAIPNEGTVLWELGTRVTGFEFRRLYGLDYRVLMKYEHVNTADEIEAVLAWFFRSVSVRVFGISRKLAFYRFLCCSGPDTGRASEYLQALQAKK